MRAERAAIVALRLVIAGIFLWHGVPKVFDPAGAAEKFVGFGLPGFLGPAVGIVEVLGAPLLLASGPVRRWAALVLLVVIAGALVIVQLPRGVTAGLERDLLIFAGLAFLASHDARQAAFE